MAIPLLDVRPDRIDLRDREYRPALVSLPPEYPRNPLIKKYFPKYMADGMVLDQGKEGACTGFGLAALINFLFWKHSTIDGEPAAVTKVSPRMLYHTARLYDEWPGEDYEGSSCRGAMKGWHRHGVCSDRHWPYQKRFVSPKDGWAADAATRTLGAYYRINKGSIADLQSAIHEVGAVYVSAMVHKGWDIKNHEYLPIIQQSDDILGGHAFSLVGYNPEGFIVQNSWGATWGYSGFAVLPYADWVETSMDAWVAVLGVPAKLPVHQAGPAVVGANLRARSTDYPRRTDPTRRWSEEYTARHCIVLGNEGQPINRLISSPNAKHAVNDVSFTFPKAWLDGGDKRKLVLYAHGGLNDEEAGTRRAQILGPYFLANGIYPVFLVWKTGFLESLVGIIEDSLLRALHRPRGLITDFFEEAKNRVAEAKDRVIESACEQVVVKAVWQQMKQNAEAAVGHGGGLAYAARSMKDLLSSGMEFHLVGHSAGAILLGHFLRRFTGRGAVKSLRLFAPACSMDFAVKYFAGAVSKRILQKDKIHVHLLDDQSERADSVGPYGKSLLYLVSRALEEYHKTPLLGMQGAWDPSTLSGKMTWPRGAAQRVINRWQVFSGGNLVPDIHSQDDGPISDGVGTIDLAHGSFDNDVSVIAHTIETIRESQIVYPVTNLRGF